MTVQVKREASVTSQQVLPTLKKHYRIPMPCHRISPGAQASHQQDSRASAIDAAPSGSLILALVFFTL